jgi:lysophospholipase L1-like esterase
MISPSPSRLESPARLETARGARVVRVVLVGDSTVCPQPPESAYRGWGEYLAESLGENVEVVNCARSGASTKTFREEGLWNEVLGLRPDWILIQLGHNDSHATNQPESTRADSDYRVNLHCFVDEARATSAQLIFVTPVRRFHFGANGRLVEKESALEPYARAMRETGREWEVPVVDLFESSTHLFERLGDAEVTKFSPAPGEDFSHFNERGARAIAQLVSDELKRVAPALGCLLSSTTV